MVPDDEFESKDKSARDAPSDSQTGAGPADIAQAGSGDVTQQDTGPVASEAVPTVVPLPNEPVAASDASAMPASTSGDPPASTVPPAGSPPDERQIFIGYRPQASPPSPPATSVPAVRLISSPAEHTFSAASPARGTRREYELPIGPAANNETDPADRLFPPELAQRPAPPGHTYPAGSTAQAIPRIQVLVTLANARALFDEALELATEKTAPRFHKIVQFELAQAEFDRKSAARAADYRLRGPS